MNTQRFVRLGVGIYEDAASIRAVVNIAAGRKEKRFPHGTSLKEIKRWRQSMMVKLERLHPQKRAGAIGRGTFAADVQRYLKTLAIASWKSRRSELRAWTVHLGPKRRAIITEDHVRAALKAWTDAGVPPKTMLNRVRALTAMYHALDGPDAWTPADAIRKPKPPKRSPLYVSIETIRAVEIRLREGDAKTHARFMVLTATGARPVFLMRAQPADVDLEQRTWNITAAKDGRPIVLWLNDDMIAAWTTFLEADAWGAFNSTDYAKALRAAGWPVDVRPYNSKHAFGQDLANRGFSPEAIADWYGHTKPETTKIYTGTMHLRRLSEAMNGRLGWAPEQPTTRSTAVDVGRLTSDERKALMQQLLAAMP